MAASRNIIGHRFGKLVVIGATSPRLISGGRRTRWIVRCDCGTEKTVLAQSLLGGTTQSCGCAPRRPTKHGKSGTPLHRRWRGMLARCRPDGHRNYGGRGIRVCSAWTDFVAFEAWAIASGFRPDLEIDRIDPDGNYEPDNCRWVTRRVNNCTRRACHRVEMAGETISLSEAVIGTGVKPGVFWSRISRQGLSAEEALAKPVYRHLRAQHGGRCLHGHEMTPENSYFSPNCPTHASCRECQRARNRRAKERKRITTCTETHDAQ